MLDYSRMAAIHCAWWQDQLSEEDSNSLNSFSGEWQIEDHDLIPSETLKNYLMERNPRKDRLSQISIKDVNSQLNDIWDGAGSMAKVVLETERLRQARTEQENPVAPVTESTTVEDFAARGRELVEGTQNGD